jgi:hypothetical protein
MTDLNIKFETNKTCSKVELIEKLDYIFTELIHAGASYSVRHFAGNKCLQIIATKDCDLVKVIIPNFVIKFDSRMARYAELILNYE